MTRIPDSWPDHLQRLRRNLERLKKRERLTLACNAEQMAVYRKLVEKRGSYYAAEVMREFGFDGVARALDEEARSSLAATSNASMPNAEES